MTACGCATLRPGEDCGAHPFDPTAYKPAPLVGGAIARSIADAAATVQNCTVADPPRTAEQRVSDLAGLLDAAVARHGVEWLVGRPPP